RSEGHPGRTKPREGPLPRRCPGTFAWLPTVAGHTSSVRGKRALRRFGNLRHSRLGSLRYVRGHGSCSNVLVLVLESPNQERPPSSTRWNQGKRPSSGPELLVEEGEGDEDE